MASTPPPTYDQLMALVNAIPALHPTGLARVIIGVFVALLAINTVAIALRIYARTVLTRGAFGVDDALASSGYVCYLVASVYGILGCYYGLGTRDADLPNQLYFVRGAQLLLWWQIPYVISIPLIKSAIAAQIMRLTPSLYCRVPLWFVIGGSTFNALAGLVAALVHCKPISASWTGMGTCGSNTPLLDLSYLFTAIAIVSDFTCALVPFFLIRGLNMNPRRKWSLVAVLSVGVGAGVFTIVRVPFFKHYLIAEDALYYQGYIAMWSMLEEGVGMFAASLPSMRKLFTNFYGSSNKSGGGATGGPSHLNSKNLPQTIGGTGGTPLNTLHPQAKRGQFSATVSSAAQGPWVPRSSWEVLDDEDANSRHGIIIQRDVYLQAGDAESQRKTTSISGSDEQLPYRK
ncbi:GPCR, PTH11-type [Niveomyces insectorum RCEF 264]|uniref:GPCR, PTH11-type n=1 Tax=Niveomyces insectorum RCEF 264 TaxID=1081102 RepID=A0A167Z151_9HYPO|nr:GPCR, PTH11-type [Niveomyces insectorum RCEF 264]